MFFRKDSAPWTWFVSYLSSRLASSSKGTLKPSVLSLYQRKKIFGKTGKKYIYM
jgi:hypothetical protein